MYWAKASLVAAFGGTAVLVVVEEVGRGSGVMADMLG